MLTHDICNIGFFLINYTLNPKRYRQHANCHTSLAKANTLLKNYLNSSQMCSFFIKTLHERQ